MSISPADTGYGSHWSTWGGQWAWGLVMLALWMAVTGGILWFGLRHFRSETPSRLDRARAILAERYARGEIDTDEYQQRLDHLH